MKEMTVGKLEVGGKQLSAHESVGGEVQTVARGRFLKIAAIRDEICNKGVTNPDAIVGELKRSKSADIFTFDQKIPDSEPRFSYYYEFDNFAVLKISDYDHWWSKEIKNDARRMVRKSEKKGVTVVVADFDDEFVKGIKGIYDESPVRQGRRFWHYGKSLETVEKENSAFLGRTDFIGAYLGSELIGFASIYYTDDRADIIQMLSKTKDRDKAPTNALLAKTIEVCASRGVSYVSYGKFSFGKRGSDTLQGFKKRNAFGQIDVPRYYIPITWKGRLALRLRLHHGVISWLPEPLVKMLLRLRSKVNEVIHRGSKP